MTRTPSIGATLRRGLPALALAVCATPGLAQLSVDAEAPSQVLDVSAAVRSVQLPTVDVDSLLAEDALAGRNAPLRYGDLIPLGIDLKELASAEVLPDGGTLWRLRLESRGAYSLGVQFEQYELPVGAGLWIHSDDGRNTLGAYTALNNKDNGQFAVQPMAGDAIVLEYVEPAGVEPGQLVLGEVVHDYRDVWTDSEFKPGSFLGSGSCNVDVNCPAGADWQDEKRAVARIFSGGILCTGALINNTAEDGKQLFWTANHCGGMNNAVFLFNYERSGCGSGGSSTSDSVQGSTLLANNSSVDYRLVRITESIPTSYDVYWLGWDRGGSTPSNTASITHPSGDRKKIAIDNHSPSKSGTDWRIAQWDLGVTEGGSSGGPLMDEDGRFIGQLCCGQAACGFPFNDYYGRLDLAWSNATIRNQLDPLGGNPTTLDGWDPNSGPSGTWTNLGNGLGGLLGAPILTGSGPQTGGSTVTLTMTNALPFGTTTLVIGLSQVNATFKGGTLVPSPDVIIGGLPLAGGNSVITFPYPPAVPSGVSVYYQHWVTDASGPVGFAASNGLRGTSP